jgi:hypothetical protein
MSLPKWLMQSLVDPTLLSGSDMSSNYVLIIASSIPSKQGVIPLTSSTLPLSPRMVSFDQNDLVEPRLPSFSPFQIMIMLKYYLKGIHQFISDEGSSASILSSPA